MKKKTVNLIKKLEAEINNISSNSIHKSTLIYSISKEFFAAINKLGKEELNAYLKNLEQGNIDAAAINFQVVSCLLVLAINQYSKNEFLQLVQPLCTDPNNNGDLISKLKTRRSNWIVIRWLQAIFNWFKRERFAVNPQHPSAIQFERAYQALRLPKKIDLAGYKSLNQDDGSLLTRTIFSIEPAHSRVEPIANLALEEQSKELSANSRREEKARWSFSRASSFSSNNSAELPPPPPTPPPLPLPPKTIQFNKTAASKKDGESNVALSKGKDAFTLDSGALVDQLKKLKPLSSQNNKVNLEAGSIAGVMLNTINSLHADIEPTLDVRRKRIVSDSSDTSSIDTTEWEAISSVSIADNLEQATSETDNQGTLGRTDSGHGSYTSLPGEEGLETLNEKESVKHSNACLFKINKESAPEKDEKQPTENSSLSVKERVEQFSYKAK